MSFPCRFDFPGLCTTFSHPDAAYLVCLGFKLALFDLTLLERQDMLHGVFLSLGSNDLFICGGFSGLFTTNLFSLGVKLGLLYMFILELKGEAHFLAGKLFGQQASVKVDAYAEPVTGQVRHVGEMLDPDTRTVKVRLPFDNRDGRLKPGMFAEATLLSRARQGMLVPMAAVVQSGFSSRAFVEVKPWSFAARELKLGAQIGQQVEVLAGLRAGDRIVVKDGVLLND